MLAISTRGETLDLRPDWTAQVISAVGNYADLIERDAGPKALLRLNDADVRVDR